MASVANPGRRYCELILTGLLRPGMSAEPTVNTKATVLAAREAQRQLASDIALVRPNGS